VGIANSHRVANLIAIGQQLMTAKTNRARRGGCAGGKFQQHGRRPVPLCCSVGCAQPRNPWRSSVGNSSYYCICPANCQCNVALPLVDRLFERKNNQPLAQARDKYRRPILMISHLNSDNTAGSEGCKLRFEFACASLDIGKCPSEFAAFVQNGSLFSCAAKRLLPRVE